MKSWFEYRTELMKQITACKAPMCCKLCHKKIKTRDKMSVISRSKEVTGVNSKLK